MKTNIGQSDYKEQSEKVNLNSDEKKVQLYFSQKKILDDFVQRGAISKEQYDKSLWDMTEKMGMKEYIDNQH